MKAKVVTLVAVLMGSLVAVAGAGCTAHVVARPAPVEVVHVEASPPARVYYGGRWLHYRGNAYYYHDHGSWVVARAVPSHVVHHHRPVHVSRHHHAVPHRTRTQVRHRSHRHHRKADVELALDKDASTVDVGSGVYMLVDFKPYG